MGNLFAKLGLTKLVIDEDDIYMIVKSVIHRPILKGAGAETKAGVSIALSSVMEALKDKEILTENTVKEVHEILSSWLNS